MSKISDHVQKLAAELYDASVKVNLDLESGHIEKLSRHSFKVRQLISEFTDLSGKTDSINFSEFIADQEKLVSINRAVSNLVEYRQRLKEIDKYPVPIGSNEAKMLKLEVHIPLKWDTNVDAVFIHSDFAYKDDLIVGLQEVGQRNLFIFDKKYIFDVETQSEIIKEDFKNFLTQNRAIVGSEALFIQNETSDINKDFQDIILRTIAEYNSRANTIAMYQEDWNENQVEGYRHRLIGYTHQDLEKFFKDQEVLVIAPGPSLAESIKQIKSSAENYFTTIATAQACPALAKHDITPDFVIVVDAKDFTYVLSEIRNLDKISLIADDVVHLNFLTAGFKNLFTIVTSKNNLGLEQALSIDPLDLVGGTVSLIACNLAKTLGAKSITLAGQDLSISKGNYFVSGGLPENITNIGRRTRVELVTYIENVSQKLPDHHVKGWNGEILVTKPDYAIFHNQFEEFARACSNTKLYNCSVGGAYIDGFVHLKISELMEMLEEKENTDHRLPTPKLKVRAERGQLFIQKNIEILEKVINILESTILIIDGENAADKQNLEQIDFFEHQLIEISKSNSQLSKFIALSIIHFKRKILYVQDLPTNLEITKDFYYQICIYLKQYKKNCLTVRRINNEIIST